MSSKNLTIVRIGLGLIFLANALVACFIPDEFKEIVEGSFLATMFPMISSATFVTLILINDGLLSLIFLFKLKFLKYALVWACVWMVAIIILQTKFSEMTSLIDAVEHIGILAIALGLFFEYR